MKTSERTTVFRGFYDTVGIGELPIYSKLQWYKHTHTCSFSDQNQLGESKVSALAVPQPGPSDLHLYFHFLRAFISLIQGESTISLTTWTNAAKR